MFSKIILFDQIIGLYTLNMKHNHVYLKKLKTKLLKDKVVYKDDVSV